VTERLRDLAVGHALSQQAQHFQLALTQWLEQGLGGGV
jgi:hypothetical protein